MVTPFEEPVTVLVALPGQGEPLELRATSVEVIHDHTRLCITELIVRNGQTEVGRFLRHQYLWWRTRVAESSLAAG
jgi:hypothetical protein